MNIGEMREQAYQKANNTTATKANTSGIDGTYKDGTTYEFKTLKGSKPSLGGKQVLQGQTSIREAIKNYLRADFLVIEMADGTILKMPRAEAVEWLAERVTLSRASSKRGGWDMLKILKQPRTAESTARILQAGYTI